ncbi:MAG: S8 family serine peptidase [Anaerolineae bacterium]|nr:S8 family serine peptidase [Anaerolineae bacterium]
MRNTKNILGFVLLCWLLFGIVKPTLGTVNISPQPPEQLYLLSQGSVSIEPDLLRALATPTDGPLHIIIRLHALENNALPKLSSYQIGSDTRMQMVTALQANFDQAIAPFIPILEEAQAHGEVLAQRELWIVNSLALTVYPEAIVRFANSASVAEIRLDHYRQYVMEPAALPDTISTVVESSPWGVTQIRAPGVWNTLQISGTGAVVAIIDTGVDLQHFDLMGNYRGNRGLGLITHSDSWFDAVSEGLYPYDDHGHGTHVAGTAVGRGGIGVAPGARWIGVKVFDGDGRAYDSWIHAGLQWLLAPDGNPALAPDVVNASWGNSNSSNVEFREDIAVLNNAGIFTSFSAGNNGPQSATLDSPGSLPGVFAVGASDRDDETAYFSSRGPSPWQEIKPYIVAPGVGVLSSMPGGIYAYKDGTSMAAPHVAGLVALMRSANPLLSLTEISQIITQTAIPLADVIPNNDSGWGRIDAFNALVMLTRPGLITGTVTESHNGIIPWAVVRAVPHHSTGLPYDNSVQVKVDSTGRYTLALLDGRYDLTATAFGYAAQTQWNVKTITDSRLQLDFTLNPLPASTVQGQMRIAETGEVPTTPVVLQVLETPISATLNAAGYYQLSLPVGTYTFEVRGLGFRVQQKQITVPPAQSVTQDFILIPVPKLLLVDEGAWYYGSQIHYWQEALDALSYPYDTLHIKYPASDTPVSRTLLAYDHVFWSSPLGSPGLVQGAAALRDYLKYGGRLFLSGQHIAYYDAGGTIAYPVQDYLRKQIGAFYDGSTWAQTLTGHGPYTGLSLTIAGKGGANNQQQSDIITAIHPDTTKFLWQYEDGGYGGIGTSICVPYRAVYFSFGYEAIADFELRQEVMSRTLAWLATPPLTRGLVLQSPSEPMVALPGTTVTHTVSLQHIGLAGTPDTVTITLQGQQWPTHLVSDVITLTPCEPVAFQVSVDIPAGMGIHESDTVIVYVTSAQVTETITAVLTTKTPAPILLVDDDRWYQMEAYYKDALNAKGIPYDVWDMKHSEGGVVGATSPSTEVLLRYPTLVWFTGYDWYRPILPEEVSRLATYLSADGRLLLSSQDFLSLHYQDEIPLSEYFGIFHWWEREAWGTEKAASVPDHPASGLWDTVNLEFPFINWSDVIEPAQNVAVTMRGDRGQPIGIAATSGLGDGRSRTLFYSFPLETLPITTRATVLERGIGWLSPLGQSTWQVHPPTPDAGEFVFANLVLYNDITMPLTAIISHTLSPSMSLVLDTLPPAMSYDPTLRILSWQGILIPDTPVTFTWTMQVSSQAKVNQPLSPTVHIALPDWKLGFDREVPLRVSGGDLTFSHWITETGTLQWSVVPTLVVNHPHTLSFVLQNTGSGTILNGRADLWLMKGLTPITVTLPPTHGYQVALWTGNLSPGATHYLTVPIRAWSQKTPLRIDAILQDGIGQRWERRQWLDIVPWQIYLPILIKQ